MKTIQMNEYGETVKVTFEQFKEKWDWNISQFGKLILYKDYEKHSKDFIELRKIAEKMLEDKFNEVYERQVMYKDLP